MSSRATLGEEIASSLTHGIGAALSLAALVAMIFTAGTAGRIAAVTVYGVTLLLLYTCSTLYHALTNHAAKRVFRILDHAAIYLLIAGTYTPFTLITLNGPWGWTLFTIVWSLAVAGIVFKCFFIGRFPFLSTGIYVGMGWLAVVAIRPLLHALPWPGFLWMVAGGLAYTAGVVFYAWKARYAHPVWHLFVLAGSACHFYAIFRYVL